MYIHRLHDLRVVSDKLRLCGEITPERVGGRQLRLRRAKLRLAPGAGLAGSFSMNRNT